MHRKRVFKCNAHARTCDNTFTANQVHRITAMHPIYCCLNRKVCHITHNRLLHLYFPFLPFSCVFNFVCNGSFWKLLSLFVLNGIFRKRKSEFIDCIHVKHAIPFLGSKLFEFVMFESGWMEFVNYIFVFLFDF